MSSPMVTINDRNFKNAMHYVYSSSIKGELMVIFDFSMSSGKRHFCKEPTIPKNALPYKFTAHYQKDTGKIYDKKPFKMTLIKGKRYMWCYCGHSKSQPICDGTHKLIGLKIKQRPIMFMVDETKEYWICNCKQTSNRPFCDGTHKRKDIQDAMY